jgi:protein O-GlcNAc transferase
MAEMSIQQAFGLALQHHNRGNLQEAQSIYQQIVAVQPTHADALHLLGVIHRRTGNPTAGIELMQRALAINPGCENANYNLGNALRDQGRSDDAVAAYRRSIAFNQNLLQSYHNLGRLLKAQGQLEQASAAFAQADALAAASHSASVPRPDLGMEWYNLGNSLREQKRYAEAINAYQKAVAHHPELAEAHCNLGNALVEEKRMDAAISAYNESLRVNPNLPQTHHNLAKVLYDQGRLDEAMRANAKALSLRPDYLSAYRNLANNLFESGQLDEAIALYQQGDFDTESRAKVAGDFIYTIHSHPAYDARAIADETRRWNEQYAKPLMAYSQPHTNDRDSDRPLRIGYVSPDFRHHVVGQNLVPLFREHDHQTFEIFCYSDASRPDAQTRRFQQWADHWSNTEDLSDEQLASLVRKDQVDILVDLALYTGKRLLVFARKPAPVQVTFAGYPGSTGLTAIDYRLSDAYLDPVGVDESIYSEKTIRLPHSFWCYDPDDCVHIPVGPLPANESGLITFGCLNNFCKINKTILDLWAKVLQCVPGSRLLLLAKQGAHRQRTIDYLATQNIEPHRIEFLSYGSRQTYLRYFHRVDVSLDSFPYNGHTTSLDSLWMAVPVVTLVGQTPVARAGWCQLSNLGLTQLAAQTPEEFVSVAVELANDLPRLKELRSTLRQRMERSPLMNAITFTRDIEAAYRVMWQRWCQGSPPCIQEK